MEKEALIMELWRNILQECEYGEELGLLCEEERIFYYVCTFEEEINSGGFSSFFYNTYGDYTQETLNALKAIGAHKTEDLMLRAVCKFKGGIVPRDMEERQDMVDELDEEDAWENLDDEYYDDKQYTIEILEMQYKYVMGNKHIFLSEF